MHGRTTIKKSINFSLCCRFLSFIQGGGGVFGIIKIFKRDDDSVTDE
jgi:hypothetical protein